jgi:hypothetical protein
MTTNALFSRLVGALVLVTLLLFSVNSATGQSGVHFWRGTSKLADGVATYMNSNTDINNRAEVNSGGELTNQYGGRITEVIVGGGAYGAGNVYNGRDGSTGSIGTANVYGAVVFNGYVYGTGTIETVNVYAGRIYNGFQGTGTIEEAIIDDLERIKNWFVFCIRRF